MLDDRLSAFMLMYCERDIMDALDIEDLLGETLLWKRHCCGTTNCTITTTKVVGLNNYALASPLRSLANKVRTKVQANSAVKHTVIIDFSLHREVASGLF